MTAAECGTPLLQRYEPCVRCPTWACAPGRLILLPRRTHNHREQERGNHSLRARRHRRALGVKPQKCGRDILVPNPTAHFAGVVEETMSLKRNLSARTGPAGRFQWISRVLTAALLALAVCVPTVAAGAAPAQAARTMTKAAKLNWKALAKCESGNRPGAVNPAGYYGLYQFNTRTWRSVGGHGMPNKASRTEQTKRAQKLYVKRGAQPWPTCGRRLVS